MFIQQKIFKKLSWSKSQAYKIIQWILPFQCPLCEIIIEEMGLCPSCWKKINFFSEPVCHTCGNPLPFSVLHANSSCGQCLRQPPLFKKNLSVFAYDDSSKKIILSFKYGYNFSLIRLLSQWLFQKGQNFFQPGTILIPVPLHWKRLLSRQFNQSALLAQALHQKTKLPYWPTALKRVQSTPYQKNMSPKERRANVKKAFSVPPRFIPYLNGKNIILIDDVYTTGATLEACTYTLLCHGVANVQTLTLAKVLL